MSSSFAGTRRLTRTSSGSLIVVSCPEDDLRCSVALSTAAISPGIVCVD
jgi:hypothetical protein